MKEITVIPNQAIGYMSMHEAILDSGFEDTEEKVEGFKNIYMKNGKYYGFIKGENFNTLIYEVTLLEVDELEDFIKYHLGKTCDELKKELLGKKFRLADLNEVCQEATDGSEDILDYSKEDFIEGDYGSFAYGTVDNQIGVYNVEFYIIEDSDDLEEITVKVTDVEVL